MKRMDKITVKALVALGCLSSVALGQLSNTGNGTTTVTSTVTATVTRLEISAFILQPMAFGTVTLVSGAAGIVQIVPQASAVTGLHGAYTGVATTQLNTSASVQVVAGDIAPLNMNVWTGTQAALQTGGTVNRTYTLILPASVTLSSPPQFGDADQTTATMTLNSFAANGGLARTMSVYDGTFELNPVTGVAAALATANTTVTRWDAVQVGATLQVGAAQRAGAYTGTISIECAYN